MLKAALQRLANEAAVRRHPMMSLADHAALDKAVAMGEAGAFGTCHAILYGDPRTKKNSRRLVRAGRRRVVLPSAAFEAWTAIAGYHLNRAWRGRPPIEVPVAVKALFYRKRDVGDLDNFEAALGDLLQTCRVVADDKQIRSWDGSRLLVDRHVPRVELWIAPMEGP